MTVESWTLSQERLATQFVRNGFRPRNSCRKPDLLGMLVTSALGRRRQRILVVLWSVSLAKTRWTAPKDDAEVDL